MTRTCTPSPLLWLIIAAVVAFPSRGRSDDGEPSPEALLRSHGLTRQGRLWILPEEQQLGDRLDTLKRFEGRQREAMAFVERLLDTNRGYLAQLTKVEETIKKTHELTDKAPAGTAQKKQLETELKNEEAVAEQLRKQYIPPEKLGVGPPLKPALVDLANAQAEATIKFLALRSVSVDLPQLYEPLEKNASVTAALAALPTKDRLGPRKELRDEWRACVKRLDAALLNDAVPVYREGGVYRVTAIVNDRRPLTFTLGKGDEPTAIAQNLAEAAGIVAPADARRVKYHAGEGRDVTAQVARIPLIRFGRDTAKNVEALVLPPEAADIGARISSAALPGYKAQIDGGNFQLKFEGVKP
ncbi:MAG TPA: retropepsin-like aspartic protease [Pirellulales bacterium]|nr:retropepsin-like aspartic protease [Pirellulales bacterium]